ncbi:hypothetical protein C943_04155 [Mariniradius saccharolyticus AK6]|uniref:Uncharacterized protein n=2 Tax=Mariniradius TaxID=1245590 RepID=M7Y9I8_9BACT|nr:hypothetical protein C943_04155 [Mariniradius saccharolyticus AK6]
MRDYIDFNEVVQNGYVTYIANNPVQTENLSQSLFKRLIINKFFDGSNQIKIIKGEDGNNELKNSTENSLFTLKVTSRPEISVSPLPSWSIQEFPKDWKKISKYYQQQYIAGGPNPTFTSWKGLELNRFKIESIVLMDRYIFESRRDGIISLIRLLEGLIDENRKSHIIHLNIVSIIKGELKDKSEYADGLHREVLKALHLKWPNLSLSIHFLAPKYFHHRYLLTDFYYITADYGFSLYNEYGLKKTKASNLISYHPISNKNASSMYLNFLSQIKNFIENGDLVENVGEKDCRLFRVLKRDHDLGTRVV